MATQKRIEFSVFSAFLGGDFLVAAQRMLKRGPATMEELRRTTKSRFNRDVDTILNQFPEQVMQRGEGEKAQYAFLEALSPVARALHRFGKGSWHPRMKTASDWGCCTF